MSMLQDRLWELQDLEYKVFQSRLIPTVQPDRVIGVRIPALRSYARELLRTAKKDGEVLTEIEKFMSELPHKYYDENNLHAFLIEGTRDYDICLEQLNRFLPYVDNWATCDMMSPKVLAKDRERLEQAITVWLSEKHPYTVRFGIGMLMRYYLDDWFEMKYLDWVAQQCCGEYYVNMMVAWYYATALAARYETVLPYIEQRRLPVWTHNKTIQKAVESNRISPEQKAYLRTLKQKNK